MPIQHTIFTLLLSLWWIIHLSMLTAVFVFNQNVHCFCDDISLIDILWLLPLNCQSFLNATLLYRSKQMSFSFIFSLYAWKCFSVLQNTCGYYGSSPLKQLYIWWNKWIKTHNMYLYWAVSDCVCLVLMYLICCLRWGKLHKDSHPLWTPMTRLQMKTKRDEKLKLLPKSLRANMYVFYL